MFILLHNKVFCTCQADCPQGNSSLLDYLNLCFDFFHQGHGVLQSFRFILLSLTFHSLEFCPLLFHNYSHTSCVSELLISSLKVG